MVGMGGERDLQKLLAGLRPHRRPGRFVFTTLSEPPPELDVTAMVREPEGISVVVDQDTADRHGFPYDFVAAMITLGADSALDGVGLTAELASALAAVGISCNVVAGHYHDHLFVPYERVDEAIVVLRGLADRDPSTT
jgi:hypothetical protein